MFISKWLKHYKDNDPRHNSYFSAAYVITPVFFLLLSIIDGLPLFSVNQLSIVTAIGIAMVLLFLTHLTIAGMACAHSQEKSETASAIAFYGVVLIIACIALV